MSDELPLDLEQLSEKSGYILDEEVLRQTHSISPDVEIKKSSNGLVLIPQPTDSPRDPLNWPRQKKMTILFMLGCCAFTADYSAATGASALIPQAEEWNITPDTVNHATAGNTFMLGAGGVVAVWLSYYLGRVPVLLYFSLLSAATAVWSANAQSFESYMASRILNGFFAVAAAAGGLMIINDIFYFHERARMINLWSTMLILSPFLGPCFMAAIVDTHSWRDGMWLNFAIISGTLVAVVLIGDESYYPRSVPIHSIPNIQGDSRYMRLLGVSQVRTRYTSTSLMGAAIRPMRTILKPPVIIICLYYFFDFGWTIANNTTISVFAIPGYNLRPSGLAALYVAPIVGAIIGMASGHFLFDITGKLYAKRNGGRLEPESRLLPLWLVLPTKIIGYNLIGSALEHRWNIYVLAVGWGLHNFSTIFTTSAVSAYVADAYPAVSGESAAWLNFARALGGFIVGYVQISWAESSGTQVEYGIQSAIMGAAFVFFVVPLQIWGRTLRHRFGPVKLEHEVHRQNN
ncbi:MFS general substrate transporter [Pseudovirgaria hyperparasitica]|uniref:MFS general substrate transporter n=1 Tax=Pseudovirgaria hyperparasitica TaxID=470096 RepID=A0A6A6W752_9PEZI|nr:MFS general substrate transporter [Pseudovirgaria hyperparasitica]KAF2758375.1 MFS general substrate transporter [Pseudovirgaria hyperparasitica]